MHTFIPSRQQGEETGWVGELGVCLFLLLYDIQDPQSMHDWGYSMCTLCGKRYASSISEAKGADGCISDVVVR